MYYLERIYVWHEDVQHVAILAKDVPEAIISEA
jgi:hypothetical protein